MNDLVPAVRAIEGHVVARADSWRQWWLTTAGYRVPCCLRDHATAVKASTCTDGLIAKGNGWEFLGVHPEV